MSSRGTAIVQGGKAGPEQLAEIEKTGMVQSIIKLQLRLTVAQAQKDRPRERQTKAIWSTCS